MIKLLLDENVPPAIGDFLRNMGLDVIHAKVLGMLGSSDDNIIEVARHKETTNISRCCSLPA